MSDSDEQPTIPVPTVNLAELSQLTEDNEAIDFESIMARERVVTPLTRVLLVLLVGAMGFWFGACLKDGGDGGGAGAPGGAGAGPGAGAGAGGAGAGAGGAGEPAGGVAGVVKLVEDGAVYVTDATGKVTKVVTGPETRITVTAEAKVSDLAPLQNVAVQGKANPDGTFTATAITETPSPAAGGG
jgi:hypothetical protein